MRKKKKASRRDKAGFKEHPSTGKNLEQLKYDKKPSTLMTSKTQDPPNRADNELRKLMSKDVFPSSRGAIRKGNTNKRRYS